MKTTVYDVFKITMENDITIEFEGQTMRTTKEFYPGKGVTVVCHMSKIEKCGFVETVQGMLKEINRRA